jgi:D-beta-D-heptose 7-phosphate kinase/D-beta-D-heptose 1-phosphate adenosyltransferase
MPAAAELAAAAAGVVVGQDGTVTCGAAELRRALAGESKQVAGLAELAARVAHYRRQGRRIVFTNGCFDLLHRGHITLLNRAKALGDVLIVGLNSDPSVRRLKGPGRPITALDDRAQLLSALSCVDHIAVFDGDMPTDLLRAIRPDIVVKGGDYTRERLPEARLIEALGGSVHLLPLVQDCSITSLIDRIRGERPALPAPAAGAVAGAGSAVALDAVGDVA